MMLFMLSGGGGAAPVAPEGVVFDFTADEAWRSIDDVVMGGVSRSEMVIDESIATFRGVLSLENNGGFASVRSQTARHDLSAYEGLVLRVRGDGNRYKLRLRTSAAFDGVSYESAFEAPEGEWADVALRFDSFRPVFRGRLVRNHPPLDPSEVRTFGLMISDEQEGPFRIDLDWIAGLLAEATVEGSSD